MKHFYKYLPLSDETRGGGLSVVVGGYTLIPAHTPYPPRVHPSDHHFLWRAGRTLQEYQLICITRGGGTFESQTGGHRQISAGDVFMLFPGEWHRYRPDPKTGWDEYWVGFQGSFAEKMVTASPFSKEEPILKTGVDAALVEEYLRIADEMRNEAFGYQKIIAARASLILALTAASAVRRSFEGTEILRVIDRAKCLLLEQSDQPVNMEVLAAELGVGYSWFRRMFRQYTGLSPAQYHLQLRITHAAELLRTTTLPIATVGQRVGFESAYYFARIFREKTGYTPSSYRASSQTHLPVDKTL